MVEDLRVLSATLSNCQPLGRAFFAVVAKCPSLSRSRSQLSRRYGAYQCLGLAAALLIAVGEQLEALGRSHPFALKVFVDALDRRFELQVGVRFQQAAYRDLGRAGIGMA